MDKVVIMYFLALLVLSYLVFVFLSDLFNPFVPIKAPMRRRRWRLGRAAALSSLIAGVIGLSVWSFNIADQRVALGLYLVLASVFVIQAVVKYKKSAIWQ